MKPSYDQFYHPFGFTIQPISASSAPPPMETVDRSPLSVYIEYLPRQILLRVSCLLSTAVCAHLSAVLTSPLHPVLLCLGTLREHSGNIRAGR